VTPCSIVVR